MKHQVAITANLTHLYEAHDFLCQAEREKMALCYGEPGTGKSLAMESLADRGAIYWQAPARPSAYWMVRSLLAALGRPPQRSFGACLDLLVESLAATRRTLILDEAGRLLWRNSEQLLEIARYLHDAAEIPVFLVGMPDIYAAMSGHRQLCDRIHFLEFLPWSQEDTRLVAKSCCEVEVGARLLHDLYGFTRGNGRLTYRCLEQIERHAKLLGLTKIEKEEWGHQPFLPTISQQPTFSKRRKTA